MGGIHFQKGADGQYPCTMGRSEIKECLCDSMRCELNCDMRGCFDCGVCDVEWHDNYVFDNLQEAKANVPRGADNYEVHAVQYYYMNPNSTKRLKDLRKRSEELENKIDDAECGKDPYFINHKSKYITCTECGSKINVELLNEMYWPNRCPVCDHDMRPETEMKKIDAMKVKQEHLKKQRDAEMERISKLSKNRKLCWYIDGSVYTG